MRFKQYIESSVIPQTVYHGTGEKFSKFNLDQSTQGIIWFTSDKESIMKGEAGAQGRGYVLSLKVDLQNPAGWDEYGKLMLAQLKSEGYDGAILPTGESEHFDGFVFDPSQIKIIGKEEV